MNLFQTMLRLGQFFPANWLANRLWTRLIVNLVREAALAQQLEMLPSD